MKREFQELLNRSFDAELTPDENKKLETALQASPELQAEKQQILAMRNLVGRGAVRSFRPFFSARVMNQIKAGKEQRTDFIASLLWSFRLIGAVAAIAIAVLLTNNIIKAGSIAPDDLLAMQKLTLEETLEIEFLPLEEL